MAKKRSSSTATETQIANAVGDLVEESIKANPGGSMKILLCVAMLVIGIVVGFAADRYLIAQSSPKVTTEDIQEQIVQVSELATEQLEYSGMVHYSEGNIKFLTEKAFTMTYNATVKAGVDLSEADIKVEDKTITVTLPKAKMMSIEIDPNSLQFQDEERAVLNWSSHDDTSTALQIAEDNAKDKVDQDGLIAKAQESSHQLIENLLKPFTIEGLGYTVNVVDAK